MDATTSGELVAGVQTLISATQANTSSFLSVIQFVFGGFVAVATLVLGANFIATLKIKSTIRDEVKKQTDEKADEMAEAIETKVADLKSEIEKIIEDKIKNEFKETERKILLVHGELARLYSANCSKLSNKKNYVDWLFVALDDYQQVEQDFGVGKMVKQLVSFFKNDDWYEKIQGLSQLDWDSYKKTVSKLPDVLHSDRAMLTEAVIQGKKLSKSEAKKK